MDSSVGSQMDVVINVIVKTSESFISVSSNFQYGSFSNLQGETGGVFGGEIQRQFSISNRSLSLWNSNANNNGPTISISANTV
jgi:hypothetical protein